MLKNCKKSIYYRFFRCVKKYKAAGKLWKMAQVTGLEPPQHLLGASKKYKAAGKLWKMAGVTGLEPAASCVTGKRSNQLSYTPKYLYRGF